MPKFVAYIKVLITRYYAQPVETLRQTLRYSLIETGCLAVVGVQKYFRLVFIFYANSQCRVEVQKSGEKQR